MIMKALKTCCCSCGCTLRTGSLITGSLSLIIAASTFIAIIFIKEGYNYRETQQLLRIDSFPIKLLLSLLLSVYAIIASVLLIIGATKGYKNWLLPWIITVPFGLLMSIPCMIFAMMEYSHDYGPAGLVFLFMILFLGGIGMHIYMLMVVISHFYELSENESTQNLETLKVGSSFEMRGYPRVPPEEF